MASLRDIFVRLGVKTDPKGMADADRGLNKIVGAAKAAVTALAGLKAVQWTSSLVAETAALGDSIDKVSSKLGVNAQALQELRFAADQTGVAQRALDIGLQRFTRRASEAAVGTGTAKDALEELGVRLKDSKGNLRPVDQLLVDVAEGLKNTATDGDRVRLAFKLFDAEGVNLVNTLKEGRSGLEALKKARDTGGIFDAELIAASVEYTDNLSEMRLAVQGVRNIIAKQLMPTASRFLKWMTEFIKRNREVIQTRLVAFFERMGRILSALGNFFGRIIDYVQLWSWPLDPVSAQFLRIAKAAAMLALVLALPLAPILVLMALVALLIEDFETWRKGGDSVIGDLVDSFKHLKAELRFFADDVGLWFAELWAGIKEGATELWSDLAASVEGYADAIADSVGAFWRWVEDHHTGITLVGSMIAGLALAIKWQIVKANATAAASFGLHTLAALPAFLAVAAGAAASAVVTAGVWVASAIASAAAWVATTATAIAGYVATAAAAVVSGAAAAAAWLVATAPLILTALLLGIIIGVVIWLGLELVKLATGSDNFFTTMSDGIGDLIDELGGIGPAIWVMLLEAGRYWAKFFGATDEQIDDFVTNATDTLQDFWKNVTEYWKAKASAAFDWILDKIPDWPFGDDEDEADDTKPKPEGDTKPGRRAPVGRPQTAAIRGATGGDERGATGGDERNAVGGDERDAAGRQPLPGVAASMPAISTDAAAQTILAGPAATSVSLPPSSTVTSRPIQNNTVGDVNVSVSLPEGMDERRYAELTAEEVGRQLESTWRLGQEDFALEGTLMALVDMLFKTRVRFGVNASDEFLPFGAVQLDASVDESHTAANDVTQFPVEVGVDITDHVRRQPDRVTIRGVVTDHPIFGASASGLIAPPLTSGRSLDAYQKVLTMVDEAQLISVVTSLRQYANMVIESLDVPRDSKRGHSVDMTLTLRQVLTAQVAVAAGTSDLGTKNTTTVT